MPRATFGAMLPLPDHPLLAVRAFVSRFAAPLGELSPLEAESSPLSLPDDALRAAVRDVLRHGGFKPTGRSKPASEYLLRAAAEGQLSPINVAVDACNLVSLHSGFPISVVDLDLARPPLRVAVAPPGASYVFNASGQVIDIGGLLCLCDADGPCANAVKDSQRTKTSPSTTRTLSVLWGTVAHEDRLHAATRWYREVLAKCGAVTEPA